MSPSRTPDGPEPQDAPMARLKPGQTFALARLQRVVIFALVLPIVAYLIVAGLLYREAFADARLRLDRATLVASEHALKMFDTNEMLLQRMLDLLEGASDEQLLARGAELQARLIQMTSTLPQVQSVLAFGADSRMLASSRTAIPRRDIDFSDRASYQAHLRGEGPPTFVTEQFVGRMTGETVFNMSRRRVHPDGSFAGSVDVSLRPEYLTEFYRELAASERDLHMTVLRTDGAVLARWPAAVSPGPAVLANDPLLQQAAAGRPWGHIESASLWDGVLRLRSFRRLGNYPVVVVASVDRSAVLAAWAERAGLLALFVIPASLGFAWIAWIAVARTRDEFDAVQRLEDETARRQRAELSLVQSNKLEAMGRLTGGVAHDFNNLLAVIGSSLEVLRRLRPELAETRQVGAIDRAVTSGAKLTRQLLAFARKQPLMPEHAVLQERMTNLTELLRPLLGAGIQLEWTVAADTAPIEVDFAELELALINLAVNAADAMQRQGRLVIDVRNAPADETPAGLEGEFVRIDVDDTGPGIDPALAEQVFEPFFTTKPIGEGTGLGLAQVRTLCQSTGGSAVILRAPGGGTRVRLWLGRSHGTSERPGVAPAPSVALRGHVLLVEDNDEVARATGDLLEALGCTVTHARGALHALACIESQHASIDLVLSDIEMPGGIDGIAMAAALREGYPSLPVILTTGYASRIEQAALEQMEVLPKPCTPEMLSEALRRAMVGRRAETPAAPQVLIGGSTLSSAAR